MELMPGVLRAGVYLGLVVGFGAYVVWLAREADFVQEVSDDAELFYKCVLPFVTFWIGFYNASGFNKWWKLREALHQVVGLHQEYAAKVCVVFNRQMPGGRFPRAEIERLVKLSLCASIACLKGFPDRRSYVMWLQNAEFFQELQQKREVKAMLLGVKPQSSYGFREVSCVLQRVCVEYLNQPPELIQMNDPVRFAGVNTLEQTREKLAAAGEELVLLTTQRLPRVYHNITFALVHITIAFLPFAHCRHTSWYYPVLATVVTTYLFYAPFIYASTVLFQPFTTGASQPTRDHFNVDTHLLEASEAVSSLFAGVPLLPADSPSSPKAGAGKAGKKKKPAKHHDHEKND